MFDGKKLSEQMEGESIPLAFSIDRKRSSSQDASESNPIVAKVQSPAIDQKRMPVSLDDCLRERFESLRRQPELVADLDCFRPGGELETIHFIAHAHGVHVARWLRLLASTQTHVTIDTANPLPAYTGEFVTLRPLVPRWLRIPMALRYVLAGLVLRFSRPRSDSQIAHAHCASGNGLVAWLSGRPYLLQIYGSEVLGAKDRSPAYRYMMRRILHDAQGISGCTPEIARVLIEQFDVQAERIYPNFLSYDDTHFYSIADSQRMQLRSEVSLPQDEPVWCVCRRTHPLYRTKEVVRGFLDFCQRGNPGRLILLCGDQQPDYTQAVRELMDSHPESHRITVVDRMLSLDEFAKWLQLSDFSISVPRTDNFSNAVLESMACGTVPILSDLEAYHEIRSSEFVRVIDRFEPSDFSTMFEETAASWQTFRDSRREGCSQYVQANYSRSIALMGIAKTYLGLTVPENDLSKESPISNRAA